MGKYFGTDGFRGEASVTLTAGHAYKIGRFLGWYYTEKRRRAAAEGVRVLAWDCRVAPDALELARQVPGRLEMNE